MVDVNAGSAIADVLRNLGHDVVSVRDRDARMADVDILAWAVAESRLVVTMDKDFGELVYRVGQAHHGVLLLRLENARIAERESVIREIFAHYSGQLPGRFPCIRMAVSAFADCRKNAGTFPRCEQQLVRIAPKRNSAAL